MAKNKHETIAGEAVLECPQFCGFAAVWYHKGINSGYGDLKSSNSMLGFGDLAQGEKKRGRAEADPKWLKTHMKLSLEGLFWEAIKFAVLQQVF